MNKIRPIFQGIFLSLLSCALLAQPSPSKASSSESTPIDHARVFITDSQSWEVAAGAGGANATFGSAARGGARPQTAEIVKTFGERCPDVVTNNIQGKTDYVVVLDHEGGKGYLTHHNKVAVFVRVTGDSIVSKSTVSLGGSVQTACEAIRADWAKNSAKIKDAEAGEFASQQKPISAQVQQISETNVTKLSVISNPVAADIEVDGAFVGNTPSTLDLTPGDHTVTISKNGFKSWERKLRANGGSVNLNVELESAK
ncbi:MAG TPA: PEGA domain-containing protein [Terriglobales bacterium]|nr:PEGA domain-containing protein [Terriglobales bacterium]